MIKSSKGNAGQVEVFQPSFSLRVILKFTIVSENHLQICEKKIKNYLVNVTYRTNISCHVLVVCGRHWIACTKS